MNRILPILLVSILIVLLSFTYPHKVDASIIFQDDFSSYPENSFPALKWVVHNQPSSTTCSDAWRVHNGEVGISINETNCTAHLIPNSSFWPTPLSDYILEFDIRFVDGIDRHIDYRIVPQQPFYRVLHFVIPGDFSVDSDNPNFTVNLYKQYVVNVKYHFKLVVTNNRLQVYESDPDDPELHLIKDVTHLAPLPPGTIGLGSNPGNSGGITETWFDNVVVSTIDEADLDVPLLKQTDPAWKNNIYDTATSWSSEPTIGAWGCALTSATMVFKYHGINKLPGNISLDPGTLNTWLKSQSDGYTRAGKVNWLALTRLSKITKSQNPSFTSGDALEFSRHGQNKNLLTADLNNNIPVILEEPGHFIVAKGVKGSTFSINDPFYDRVDLTSYSNSFISMRRFVPSHTDLSYIMAVVDPSVNIQLKTSSGSAVGELYIEQPLDRDGGVGNSGPDQKVLLLPKPESGNYSFEITSSSNASYQLDLYLYDKDGNVKVINSQGVVGNGSPDNYVINYDKENSNNSNSTQSASFQEFIADINALFSSKQINLQFYAPSIVRANVAWGLSGKRPTKKEAINQLKLIDSDLLKWKNKGVTLGAYNILHADIQSLLVTLN